MKAIILSAGYGYRLGDLVNELPIKNKIFELIISNNTYKIYKKS